MDNKLFRWDKAEVNKGRVGISQSVLYGRCGAYELVSVCTSVYCAICEEEWYGMVWYGTAWHGMARRFEYRAT